MSVLNTIFQAIIQGLTEFLPISSSGHLSLFQHFTGKSGEGALLLSAILHLGTLVAIFIAFWPTIWDLIKEFGRSLKDLVHREFFKNMNGDRRAIIMLIISTLVLVPFYLFKNFFEGFAEDASIFAEGICFLYTASILFLSDKCTKGSKTLGQISGKDAVTVGFFQSIALLPGVSRSGSTISSGLFCGMARDTAVKYSFILGIPAVLGGCFVELKDAIKTDMSFKADYIIGFFIAAVVGIGAIKMVSWLVKSDKFKVFAYYTAILGIIVILISIVEAIIGKPLSL